MKFEEIHAAVGDVPYIRAENARRLYDLMLEERLTRPLELGFAHGTASCIMAAALDELGEGRLTAVDLIGARELFRPSIEEQLEKVGLSKWVRIVRMQTGYNWFLHDEIVRNTRNDVCHPAHDLCIIDGPKNWTIDGAAFFFADKLLEKGGWMIFDDYEWTHDSVEPRVETDGITHRSLSDEERATPHVREIFELLVKQHPDYGRLERFGPDWALAQKTSSPSKSYVIVPSEPPLHTLIRWVRQARGRLFTPRRRT